MRQVVLVALITISFALTLVLQDSDPVTAQQACPVRGCVGGGPDGSGINVRTRYNGPGRGVSVSVPAGDPCSYEAPTFALAAGGVGGARPGMILRGTVVFQYIRTTCDGVLVDFAYYELGPPVADIEALAAEALANEVWHQVEVVTGPDPVVVSGLPVAFSLQGDPRGFGFDADLVATAEAAGVEVTATASAVNVEWHAGSINSRYGGPDFVDCDNFGDLSFEFPVDTPCHFTWLSSSALEPGGRITMIATIEYQIVYTTNLPPAIGVPVFGVPVWFHVIERPGYAVSEAHSVIQE